MSGAPGFRISDFWGFVEGSDFGVGLSEYVLFARLGDSRRFFQIPNQLVQFVGIGGKAVKNFLTNMAFTFDRILVTSGGRGCVFHLGSLLPAATVGGP